MSGHVQLFNFFTLQTDVSIDHVVRHHAASGQEVTIRIQGIQRHLKRAGHSGDFFRFFWWQVVQVFIHSIARMNLVLNAVQARHHHGREGEVDEAPVGIDDLVGLHADQRPEIEAAGEGGTVLLEAGLHKESATVLISERVRITGEEGAVLEFDSDDTSDFPYVAEPALHVKDASRVVIEGLTIMDTDTSGSVAILIESSFLTRIKDNRLIGYENSIVNQFGESTRVHGNEILSPKPLGGFGILSVNGKAFYAYNNYILAGNAGLFVGDEKGLLVNNHFTTTSGSIGFLFCTPNIGGVYILLPSGEMAVAETSANRWLAWRNYAENFLWNYLVIDNANNNTLVNNRADNAGIADIELAGESERFGFFTPKAFDNLVLSQGEPDVTIKVCGEGNFAVGGQLMDNGESPCN